ncbi:hypothetical protein [Bergeyella zoohelcum]|uniref:hypothetical protein n=1 Tax=Bergeyella zoohelcum TaxID=1015 RepID=UPI00373555B8
MFEILVFFIGVIAFLILVFINYLIIRTAVEKGTKYALQQSEYYLEIIAKEYFERQQKDKGLEKKESNKTNESEDDELIFME